MLTISKQGKWRRIAGAVLGSKTVRSRAIPVAILAICAGSSALAGPPSSGAVELQAAGEQLAKQGDFAGAIAKFKAADAVYENAAHACLIGLAYARLQRWGEADLWVSLCEERASSTEPPPTWLPSVRRDIARGLADAGVADVDIRLAPPVAGARIGVSIFAPDERFAPRTFHLPPGHHEIVVDAPGYLEARRTIEITDTTPRRLTIRLEPAPATAAPPPPAPPAPTPPATRPDPLPHRLVLAGAIVAGAGLASYGVMSYAWLQLRDRNESRGTYDTYHPIYTASRVATVGLCAAGAGLAVAGYLLHRRHPEAPAPAIAPTEGGAVLGLEWQR